MCCFKLHHLETKLVVMVLAVHVLAGWLILVFLKLFIPGLLVKRRLLALQPDDETGVFKAKTAWVVLLNIVPVYVHMCVSISKVVCKIT